MHASLRQRGHELRELTRGSGDAHPSGTLRHSWPRSMAQIQTNFGTVTYDPLYPYGFWMTPEPRRHVPGGNGDV